MSKLPYTPTSDELHNLKSATVIERVLRLIFAVKVISAKQYENTTRKAWFGK